MLQTKVAQNLISYKKLSGSISVPTPGAELGAPKICSFRIIVMHGNGRKTIYISF